MKLQNSYLKAVEKVAIPLENRSKSSYNNEEKNECRRRRAAWNLQLIDKGLLDKGAYFGLPGDSFLMEELSSKLGTSKTSKMHLIDRDALWDSPNGMPSVKRLTVSEFSESLKGTPLSSDNYISTADVDICSPIVIKDNLCKLADDCVGLWKHSKFLSITLNAAREPGGMKVLQKYLKDNHVTTSRIGGNSLGSIFASFGESKQVWQNYLRLQVITIAMRKSLDKAGHRKSKLLVLDATAYNGTNKYPMLAVTFVRDLNSTPKNFR